MKKCLVTLDKWFIAPNGKEYISLFGTIDDGLDKHGFMKVGNVLVHIKRIISMVDCSKCNLEEAEAWMTCPNNGIINYKHPSKIYDADLKSVPNVVELKK